VLEPTVAATAWRVATGLWFSIAVAGGSKTRWTRWSALGASKVPSSPSVRTRCSGTGAWTSLTAVFQMVPTGLGSPRLRIKEVDNLDCEVPDDGDHGVDLDDDRFEAVGQVGRRGVRTSRTSRP